MINLKDEIDGKERELKKSKREVEKWQREVTMLKEELSIVGSGLGQERKITTRYQSPHIDQDDRSRT